MPDSEQKKPQEFQGYHEDLDRSKKVMEDGTEHVRQLVESLKTEQINRTKRKQSLKELGANDDQLEAQERIWRENDEQEITLAKSLVKKALQKEKAPTPWQKIDQTAAQKKAELNSELDEQQLAAEMAEVQEMIDRAAPIEFPSPASATEQPLSQTEPELLQTKETTPAPEVTLPPEQIPEPTPKTAEKPKSEPALTPAEQRAQKRIDDTVVSLQKKMSADKWLKIVSDPLFQLLTASNIRADNREQAVKWIEKEAKLFSIGEAVDAFVERTEFSFQLGLDTFTDHYAVLGVPPNATIQQINKAALDLNKIFHPDTLSGLEDHPNTLRLAEQITKKVNDAASVLKNPRARSNYDADIERATKVRTAQESSSSDQKKGNNNGNEEASPKAESQNEINAVANKVKDALNRYTKTENKNDGYYTAIALMQRIDLALRKGETEFFCDLRDRNDRFSIGAAAAEDWAEIMKTVINKQGENIFRAEVVKGKVGNPDKPSESASRLKITIRNQEAKGQQQESREQSPPRDKENENKYRTAEQNPKIKDILDRLTRVKRVYEIKKILVELMNLNAKIEGINGSGQKFTRYPGDILISIQEAEGMLSRGSDSELNAAIEKISKSYDIQQTVAVEMRNTRIYLNVIKRLDPSVEDMLNALLGLQEVGYVWWVPREGEQVPRFPAYIREKIMEFDKPAGVATKLERIQRVASIEGIDLKAFYSYWSSLDRETRARLHIPERIKARFEAYVKERERR